MSDLINIYCDESCHLEHDHQRVMVLGCIWTPASHVRRLANELRDIKERRQARGELKWAKVSRSREKFFEEVVDWFFGEELLHFRCLVVSDKSRLDHAAFNDGSHDTFYYKMHFSMLSKILSPTEQYDVYFDIKDTRSRFKLQKLHDVLCNDRYDFTHQMVRRLQHVRSNEVELMQLADFLIGAVSYRNRDLATSEVKSRLVQKIENHHGSKLTQSTSLSNTKFNIFVWCPRGAAAF